MLVCEGLEKPGNLGAVLRTADAAGVAAVVAADPVTDWGNPNVVRSSKGTVFSVPVAAATTPEVLAWLRRNGIRLVATTPDTEAAHTAVDYRGAVAIAVGTEKEGLTDVALRRRRRPGAHPDGRSGQLAQRRDGCRRRRVRGGPPALLMSAGVTPVARCGHADVTVRQVDRAVSRASLCVCDDDVHAS